MHAVSNPVIETNVQAYVCHVRRLLLTPSLYLSPFLNIRQKSRKIAIKVIIHRFKVIQGHRLCHQLKWHVCSYWWLIETLAVSRTVRSYTATHWTQSRLWDLPVSQLTPSLGVTLCELYVDEPYIARTRVCIILHSFVLTQYQCDSRTDRRTDMLQLRQHSVQLRVVNTAGIVNITQDEA